MASDGSQYGKKPLYYGSTKKSPIYYGSARSPIYYGGGGAYGGAPYYYGGSYGGNSPSQDADSLVGTITLGRILRVIAQRWISVLVFLLIGLVAAFAVYRISPTIYEAKSEFTMDMRRPSNSGPGIGQIDMPDYGTSYEEVFNTRLSDWRSDKIVTKIIQQYRANYPASTVTDAELVSTLGSSMLELIRHSRLITISVRSRVPAIAAALANAYAEAIESFTDDENKIRCDKAVAQIHEAVEKQRRTDEKVAKALLDFRTANKIDHLHSERAILQQSLTKTTGDILGLETEVTAAAEWEKVLEAAQETPEDFGALPTAVPRSSEIGQSYTTLQNANLDLIGQTVDICVSPSKGYRTANAGQSVISSVLKYPAKVVEPRKPTITVTVNSENILVDSNYTEAYQGKVTLNRPYPTPPRRSTSPSARLRPSRALRPTWPTTCAFRTRPTATATKARLRSNFRAIRSSRLSTCLPWAPTKTLTATSSPRVSASPWRRFRAPPIQMR